MRKLTKVLASVAAAAIFTISAALPAQAAGNDFTPSPNKFREYMVNVTSKVLKGAMPDAWKREQLANEFRYNHAWETMNAQFGFSAANPNYIGAPDSYDDYMVRKAQMDMQGGTGGKPFGAPATKPSKWQKTAKAGGGLIALSGFPVGSFLGTAGIDVVGGWFGFDAEGAVCGQTDGWGKDVAQLLTGRDCSMWNPTQGYLDSLAGDAAKCTAAGIQGFCVVGGGIVSVKNQTGALYTVYLCAPFERLDPSAVPGPAKHAGSANASSGWVYEFEYGTWNVGNSRYANGTDQANACPGKMAHDFRSSQTQTQANSYLAYGSLVDYYSVWNGVRETNGEIGGTSEVQLECEVTLDDGSTIRAVGARYNKDTDAIAPPACPAVPDGRTATNVDIREQQPGAAPGTGTSVSSQPTTPEYQDWATTYPECGTGACKLDLIQKPKASCFDLEYQCADWFEDPDKANKYQCRYGVKDVALEECAVYAGLFKPGRVDTGSPYTDPETGVWSGGKNALEESRNAMGLPVQNPADIRGCDGTTGSGSFDPIRFIMRPIQCALEWAFVPRPAVVEAELSGGEQAWNNKPPKVIADAVAGFSVSPSASGCSRSVTLLSSTDFATTAELFNFCPGSPARPLADFSRLATTAAMVVLVVVVVRRQIAGMIGYGAGQ